MLPTIILFFALRLLGLFMIIPTIAVFAPELPGASSQTIGFALGVYGLTQAISQLPFGFASDRFGRRALVRLALVFLFVGSVMGALATNITMLILARAMQGFGAMGSVLLAALVDEVELEHMAKSMAMIGISMGAAFVAAMILGPWIYETWGFPALFWVMAAFVLMLWPKTKRFSNEPKAPQFKASMPSGIAFPVVFIAFSHMVLAMTFLPLPALVREVYSYSPPVVYTGALALALTFALPGLRWVHQRFLPVYFVSLAMLTIGVGVLAKGNFFMLVSFFAGFCLLEAALPALIARLVDDTQRGLAMGMFSTAQYLGVFLGGTIGGWLWQDKTSGILMGLAVVFALWWIFSFILMRFLWHVGSTKSLSSAT